MQREPGNACVPFSVARPTCLDALTSEPAGELVLDILETEKECRLRDEEVCTRDRVENLRREEKLYWRCLDAVCGTKSGDLVEGRDLLLRKLESSFDSLP
jgi:hypothetical protein